MVDPEPPIVALGCDERARVVHKATHAERRRRIARRGRRLARRRWRAAFNSDSLNGPCSASHSATAANPSRTFRASRAASVSQADTLTPRRAAAARTCAWTSGAIVIASFGEGWPGGIREVYYRSMIPTSVSVIVASALDMVAGGQDPDARQEKGRG